MENTDALKSIELLKPNPKRFVIFPIEHHDLWEYYKKQLAVFWTAEEIDFVEDISDWRHKLSDDERYFVKMVLAFFAASDGIVNENIALNFLQEIQIPEARAFLTTQINIETIHSETYSLLIDTFIQDAEEKDKLLNAIEHYPIINKKADWALKWMEDKSIVNQLVAFACVEGLFFSASFSSIFWLKSRGLMTAALTFSNELISRDEALHADFSCHLYKNYIPENLKLPKEEVYALVEEALNLEKEFARESIPVTLIGINPDLMCQYLEYVADNLLIAFGLETRYKSQNPFNFMKNIALETKTNFFESRVAEYEKASVQGEDPFADMDSF